MSTKANGLAWWWDTHILFDMAIRPTLFLMDFGCRHHIKCTIPTFVNTIFRISSLKRLLVLRGHNSISFLRSWTEAQPHTSQSSSTFRTTVIAQWFPYKCHLLSGREVEEQISYQNSNEDPLRIRVGWVKALRWTTRVNPLVQPCRCCSPHIQEAVLNRKSCSTKRHRHSPHRLRPPHSSFIELVLPKGRFSISS